MRRLHARAKDFLRTRLGAHHPALAFAEAVVLQVAHPLGGGKGEGRHREERVAQRTADLLLACERHEAGPAVAARLASDPVFLAACFQNVDLLYRHEYRSADALSMVVMEALHRAGDGEGAPGRHV